MAAHTGAVLVAADDARARPPTAEEKAKKAGKPRARKDPLAPKRASTACARRADEFSNAWRRRGGRDAESPRRRVTAMT